MENPPKVLHYRDLIYKLDEEIEKEKAASKDPTLYTDYHRSFECPEDDYKIECTVCKNLTAIGELSLIDTELEGGDLMSPDLVDADGDRIEDFYIVKGDIIEGYICGNDCREDYLLLPLLYDGTVKE